MTSAQEQAAAALAEVVMLDDESPQAFALAEAVAAGIAARNDREPVDPEAAQAALDEMRRRALGGDT